MKNLTPLFGIALLAAAMAFSLASCDNDPDTGNDPGWPEIPAVLQNTEWTNNSGDKISFTKDSVTITPSGGQAQAFKLKDVLVVDQINQTTLFFGDSQTKDFIVYRNDVVTTVDFNMIDFFSRIFGWGKGNNGNKEPVSGSGVYGDFLYSYIDTTVTITKYTGTDDNIVIPDTIDGMPVVVIGYRAFYEKSLTVVTIPDSVTTIEDSAFHYNRISSITIPDSVTTIAKYAFRLNELTSVTISNSVTTIGKEAFRYNQLTSVTIPNSVTTIEYGAFANKVLVSKLSNLYYNS